MGEVIECNIICRQKIPISYFIQFLKTQRHDCNIRRTVEVMDNWRYENLFEVPFDENIDGYIDNKIVQIIETSDSGQAGISIECLNGDYSYCIWFNQKEFLSDFQYKEFINVFIKYIFDISIVDTLIIGAIGKEVVFDYSNDLITSLLSAHGIDVWILDQTECIEDILKNYKLLELQGCEALNKYVFTKIHE